MDTVASTKPKFHSKDLRIKKPKQEIINRGASLIGKAKKFDINMTKDCKKCYCMNENINKFRDKLTVRKLRQNNAKERYAINF